MKTEEERRESARQAEARYRRAHPDKCRAHVRAYHAKNKEYCRQLTRLWYVKHRARLLVVAKAKRDADPRRREKSAEYERKNKDRRREQRKALRDANPEVFRERVRQWRKKQLADPLLRKRYLARCRAREWLRYHSNPKRKADILARRAVFLRRVAQERALDSAWYRKFLADKRDWANRKNARRRAAKAYYAAYYAAHRDELKSYQQSYYRRKKESEFMHMAAQLSTTAAG